MPDEPVERYDVIFSGGLLPGADDGAVRAALAARFGLKPAAIERLFDGRPHRVKKRLDRSRAERYVAEFERLGAVTRLRLVEGDTAGKALAADPGESAVVTKKTPRPRDDEAEDAVPAASPASTRSVATPSRGCNFRWLLASAALGILAGAFAWSQVATDAAPAKQTEHVLLTELTAELRATDAEIAAITQRREQSKDPSMVALIDTRVELLELTAALLRQRIHAVESGTPMDMVVPVARPAPALASTLADEVAVLTQRLADRHADANASGRAPAAAIQATVALEEQALAALRLQYLSARFGLPPVVFELPTDAASGPEVGPSVKHEPVVQRVVGAGDQSTELDVTASATPVSRGEDGPFGLRMGLNAQALGARGLAGQPGAYELPSVPVPHNGFHTYLARIGPESGLCWIKAVGREVKTNQHGIALRRAFKEMEGKLAGVYGEFEHTDILAGGSTWSLPRDWMMGLVKNERYLISIWEQGGKARLDGELQSVALSAAAESRTRGYISIEYRFRNYDTCDAEILQRANAML